MNNGLGRLLMWVAEMLDRSLLTVPDVDELDAHMLDASKTQSSQSRTYAR